MSDQKDEINKAELLHELHKRHQNWQALLDQIGLARTDQPAINGIQRKLGNMVFRISPTGEPAITKHI